jgi:lipopolysaccharide transport system ATP-binding protein
MPQAGPQGFVARESANQIARKFDEIVEFSGCARYIDTPVQSYSSGRALSAEV